MHNSLPHPTQVRSACERCRKQKLRCTRPSALAARCTRCQTLEMECQLGPSRKVGRPSKKDLAGKKAPVIDDGANQASPDVQRQAPSPVTPEDVFDPQVLGQDPNQGAPIDMESMDWMLPEMSEFLLNSVEEVVPSLTLDDCPSAFEHHVQRYPPPEAPSTIIHLTRKEQFSSLSKINLELHDLWETMRHQPANGTLEGFLCDCNLVDGSTMKPYQTLMKLLQDYLTTIKAIHKALGTNQDSVKSRAAVWMPRACLILQSNSSDTSSPACTSSSSTCNGSTGGSPHNSTKSPAADRVVLDSPTALLVISCFSQIVQHLEIFISISQSRLMDPTAPFVPPDNASFAGIAIIEFLTQGALFTEVLRNNFAQIILVLGLPTEPWWSGNSVWTGLLVEQRFRDLLNHELGSVENGWTTRPTALMQMIDRCKKLVIDSMMSGCMDV